MRGQQLANLLDLPKQLLLLNLSGCGLTSLKGVSACVSLKLLNASHNRLVSMGDLSGLKQLVELYIGYNKLDSLGFCMRLRSLQVLDVAGNRCVRTFEDVAILACNQKLQVLRLKDTELSHKSDYVAVIHSLCPHLIHIDPPDLFQLSCYHAVLNFITSSVDAQIDLRTETKRQANPKSKRQLREGSSRLGRCGSQNVFVPLHVSQKIASRTETRCTTTSMLVYSLTSDIAHITGSYGRKFDASGAQTQSKKAIDGRMSPKGYNTTNPGVGLNGITRVVLADQTAYRNNRPTYATHFV